MRKKGFLVLLIICVVFCASFFVSCKDKEEVEDPNTIYVMSFNIRQDTFIDTGVKDWDYRSAYVIDHIKSKAPHLICIQEVKESQITDLRESLSDKYDFIYYDRGDGEGLALAYNKDYELKETDVYWLSETPDVKSKGFGSRYYRICAYMVVKKTATEEEFIVSNVHLDHMVFKARINGIKLVLDKIAEYDMPKIVCGDFNCYNTEETYSEIANVLQDSQAVAKKTMDGYTYHDWGNKSKVNTGAIDYCFVSDEYEINEFDIFRENSTNENDEAVYYSDHYAIMSKILLKK